MKRNIENRVEVSCPIYQDDIKKELLDVFDICWSDNVKARVIESSQSNEYRKDSKVKVRAQFALYDYFKEKLNS